MNNRVHSAIGMRPSEVNTENAMSIFKKLYPYVARNLQPPRALKPEFLIGDTVRILNPSKIFIKGFEAKTSESIYKIAKILFHPTIRYKLSPLDSDSIISGSFTSNELIGVALPQIK